jgi:hypothetical protein
MAAAVRQLSCLDSLVSLALEANECTHTHPDLVLEEDEEAAGGLQAAGMQAYNMTSTSTTSQMHAGLQGSQGGRPTGGAGSSSESHR